MSGPGLYAAVAVRSFRRYSTYRAATLAGAFTNSVFGVILAYTFVALWSERPDLGGYDVTTAVTFVWIGQALLAPVAIFASGAEADLVERVRTGDVAIDLYRPTDLQLWWLAADLGRAAFQLLARGLPPALVGLLIFDLRFSSNPLTWLVFLLSVGLAVTVSFSIRYLVALSGFWLLDVRGAQTVAVVLSTFFSGLFLPLVIFPGWLRDVAFALPWASLLQLPADVLLEERTGWSVVQALAFQAAWATALLLLGRLVLRVATRRVVVQGG
ncbi:MAG: ABC transporter permease [Nocardioidaceae bacterium]